jgi:hypothetical protein
MADRRFITVIFEFNGEPNYSDLNPIFDRALDWVRFTPNSWLLWTSSTPNQWYSRLKSQLREGDRFFICEVNMEQRSGWMQRSFWDFIKSHQEQDSSSN